MDRMTLSDINRLCPPPEGWSEWVETKPHTEWVTRRTEPKEHIRITRHEDTFAVSVLTSEAMYHGPWTPDADLPSAYRRALVAVGLASPWTREVPTSPGEYLVKQPGVRVFVLDHDGRDWVPPTPRDKAALFWMYLPPPGTLFMRISPQPP